MAIITVELSKEEIEYLLLHITWEGLSDNFRIPLVKKLAKALLAGDTKDTQILANKAQS